MLVRYFASVREALPVDEETVVEACASVQDLLRLLRQRGEPWSTIFTDESLHVAVNWTLVAVDHPLQEADEVAIFPPVTGG